MSKVIQHIKLTDTIAITECANGWWLYDKTRGMNLAMRSKSERDAFVKALEYYQERLTYMDKVYHSLKCKVNNFVNVFAEEDNY